MNKIFPKTMVLKTVVNWRWRECECECGARAFGIDSADAADSVGSFMSLPLFDCW